MKELFSGWLPANISAHGAEVDRLIVLIHAFMAILFIGWLGFMLAAIFRFRARAGHSARYDIGHFDAPTYLEIAVAVFEVVLLFFFAIPFWNNVRMKMPPGEKALQIRVVAEQFAWNIHYPGPDGVFGRTDFKLMDPSNPLGLDRSDPAAQDDVTTINQMHVPIHTPVIVDLTSKDVIHSFAVNVMRVKQDVIPGEVIPLWFEAAKTGQFEISCAQLCGLGHYRMRGYFISETPEEFNAWLSSLAPQPPAPAAPSPLPPVLQSPPPSPAAAKHP